MQLRFFTPLVISFLFFPFIFPQTAHGWGQDYSSEQNTFEAKSHRSNKDARIDRKTGALSGEGQMTEAEQAAQQVSGDEAQQRRFREARRRKLGEERKKLQQSLKEDQTIDQQLGT